MSPETDTNVRHDGCEQVESAQKTNEAGQRANDCPAPSEPEVEAPMKTSVRAESSTRQGGRA